MPSFVLAKVPNREIDKAEGKFFTHWDAGKLTFHLQLFFKDSVMPAPPPMPPPAA